MKGKTRIMWAVVNDKGRFMKTFPDFIVGSNSGPTFTKDIGKALLFNRRMDADNVSIAGCRPIKATVGQIEMVLYKLPVL